MTSAAIYRRLLRFARPYWAHLVALFALSLLAIPLTLLIPLPLKIVVDSAIEKHPLPEFLQRAFPSALVATTTRILLLAIGLLFLITVLSQLQQLARTLFTTYLAEQLLFRFRAELFRHMQRLSLAYHDMTGSSDSLYRIQYDAMAIQYVTIDGVIPVVVSLSTLVAMVIVTFRLDPALAAVALTVMPVLFVILRYFRPLLREQSKQVKELESSAMSVVQEVLGAVRVVKAFGQEGREQSRFADHFGQGLAARLRMTSVEGVMSLLVGIVIAMGTAAVLYLGVLHVQNGSLSLGRLLPSLTHSCVLLSVFA